MTMKEHPLEKFRFCPVCGSSHFEYNDPRSKRCRDCGFTYYTNAAAAVAAIITNEKSEILLVRRALDPAKGTLDLPGGFVELRETAEEALRREIHEELAVELTNLRYRMSMPNEYTYSGLTVYTEDLFFTARIKAGQTITAGDDAEQARFYDIRDVRLEEIGLKSIRTVMKKIRNNEIKLQ